MGIGVLVFSGFSGFVAAVFAGLMLGLSFLEAFGVYWGTGVVVAAALFALRGIYCAAARQLSPV